MIHNIITSLKFRSKSFQIYDPDFTWFPLIPTILLGIINITDSVDGSWYDGQVYVGFKEAIFEPSSALRNVSELHNTVMAETVSFYCKNLYCFFTQMVDQTTEPPSFQFSYLLYSPFPESRLPLHCQDCPSQFLIQWRG